MRVPLASRTVLHRQLPAKVAARVRNAVQSTLALAGGCVDLMAESSPSVEGNFCWSRSVAKTLLAVANQMRSLARRVDARVAAPA